MAVSEPSHHKPNLRWDALTPTIITTTLATAVVILRLVVRCKFVKTVGFDDFVTMVSLVSILVSCRGRCELCMHLPQLIFSNPSFFDQAWFPHRTTSHPPSFTASSFITASGLQIYSSFPGSSLVLPWPWSYQDSAATSGPTLSICIRQPPNSTSAGTSSMSSLFTSLKLRSLLNTCASFPLVQCDGSHGSSLPLSYLLSSGESLLPSSSVIQSEKCGDQ